MVLMYGLFLLCVGESIFARSGEGGGDVCLDLFRNLWNAKGGCHIPFVGVVYI